MAALAAAIAGGSALATVGSSLGAAGIQAANQTSINEKNLAFQQQQFDYSKSLVDRGVNSFKNAGLPEFMYWGGQNDASQIPSTLFHLGGSNFYEGMGVNSNLPYFTPSPYSQWMHTGQPKGAQQDPKSPSISSFGRNSGASSGSISSNSSATDQSNTRSFTVGNRTFSGQTDTKGLGNGRYNATPPPSLAYNSRGVGTNNSYRSFSSQTFNPTRDFNTQTYSNMGNFTRDRNVQTQSNMGNFTRNAFSQTRLSLGSGNSLLASN